MHSNWKRLALVLLAWVSMGAEASAQTWLSLPDLSVERGIHAGTFKFWPEVAIEGRWDSNIFSVAEGDVDARMSTALLRVLPGLRIDNPEYDTIHLEFSVLGDIRQYFADDPAVEAQPQFGVDANFGMELFPRAVASFRVFDAFRDTLEAPNFSITDSFQRLSNKAGGRLSIHPGGTADRRALDVSAQYAYGFDKFLDFEQFDKQTHEINLLGSWKFYPKTALVLDATLGFNSWDSPDPAQGRTDSMPLRARLGVSGFITKTIAGTLKLGYGQGFYDAGDDFQSVLAAVHFAWMPLEVTLLDLGYDRDFVDSYFANYYVSDKVSLKFQQRLWELLTIKLDTSYSFLDFGDVTPAPDRVFLPSNDRSEQVLRVDFALDFNIIRYLGATIGYQMTDVFSDFEQRLVQDNTLIDRGGYLRHQVYGSLTARY